jgi:N-acetylglucosamine-6-phosphate deacetylase
MASLNPARVIGVDDRKGSLEPGKDADLVVIDEEVEVYMTMVRGQEVYSLLD